jgi:5-oxoprolinase (ATP-hydrolysing)
VKGNCCCREPGAFLHVRNWTRSGLKPLTIIAPAGTILNVQPPAAVIAGNTEISQAATNALFGALGVLAGSQATMNNFVWGNARFQNYETICGGIGAGRGHDGAGPLQTHMTNTRMTDPEVLEWRFPVRLEQMSIRHGSGGRGRWTGGNGCIRRLRFLDAVTVTTLNSYRLVPPFGLEGGAPGKVGIDWLERRDGTRVPLKGCDQIDAAPGDLYHMETPGRRRVRANVAQHAGHRRAKRRRSSNGIGERGDAVL